MPTLAELEFETAVTVGPDETAATALERMLEAETTEVYVVDTEQRLQGIVPDYELLKARLNGSWDGLTVQNIMSHRVLCFTTETSVTETLKTFREGQHSRAALLRDGQVIGQITRTTLLRSLCGEKTSVTPRPMFLRSELARNAMTLRSELIG